MFPTREQELLLRAALMQGETALQAWQHWKAHVNLEQGLDLGSYRLLPLVYHNLRQLGVDDPLMSKLKGIHHREWFNNQMLFHTIAEVLNLFHTAGIETMILKGAALTLLYYKDYGLRPMSDFDVLVPIAKREAAINVLTQAGWRPLLRPLEKLTASVLDAKHAWGFENAQQRQFDLHWHVLYWGSHWNADDDFWDDAIPVKVANVPTCALNPTDQLLHVCFHATAWNPVPSVRWIADAMVMLRASPSEVAWTRLVEEAEQRRLTLPVRHALTYLRDSFGAPIPEDVLLEMSRVRVSDIERRWFRAAAKGSLVARLQRHWYRHSMKREMEGERNWAKKLFTFPRYLQCTQAMDTGELLKWAISRMIVRIRNAVCGIDQG